MRVAILAHGSFPARAKVALGILRYGEQEVVAVLDRDRAGDRVRDHVDDRRASSEGEGGRYGAVADAPIVASMRDAPACDALVIGVAPIGGGFESSWRPDVRTAIERGCDVYAGLHYRLSTDEEFTSLAADHGGTLHDVREPPSDLDVADGTAGDVDARVVATVGTDCSVGKLTTTMELVGSLRREGVDAVAVPTGQTGILIEGSGIALDRTISDYTAGAAERLVETAAAEHDVLVVEGQGSIVHPAYSAVTCGLLHGAMPDALVYCHETGREVIHGYERFELPPVEEIARRYESFLEPVSPAPVVAGSLHTSGIDDRDAASTAVDAFADELGAPATDPIRFGTDEILEAVGASHVEA